MTISADREQRIEDLKSHERRLTNGGRGSVDALSDAVVSLSHAMRVMLATDFVTPETCRRRHKYGAGVVLAAVVPVMLTVLTIAVMILFSGCSTARPTYDFVANVQQAPEPAEAHIVRGVHIGVQTTFGNQLCPGAEKDARTARKWLAGRTTYLLLNPTLATVKDTLLAAATGLRPQDMLVVTISGHGTQRPDLSGDEADWKDEGVVLYDQTWWDDDVWVFLRDTIPACRILLISDTCHSEGAWRTLARVATFGLYDGRRYVQMELDLGDQRRSDEWPGMLAQIAGCREEGYSYGSDEDGGTLTQTLTRLIPRADSIQAWFDLTHAAIAPHGKQEPVLTTYKATDEWLNGGLFE